MLHVAPVWAVNHTSSVFSDTSVDESIPNLRELPLWTHINIVALSSISLTQCVPMQSFLPVRCCPDFFLKGLFKGETPQLFFKDYLNLSVIYGSPLTLEEIASHPRKKNNQPSGKSEIRHKLASSAYNVEQQYMNILFFCCYSGGRMRVKRVREPQLNYSLLAPTVCFQPALIYIYRESENVTVKFFLLV